VPSFGDGVALWSFCASLVALAVAFITCLHVGIKS
jgi:hypothetical protein